MNKKMKGLFAALVYLLLIFLPLFVFLLFDMPARREPWRDISVMLGFVGLAMAGLQFLPVARIKALANTLDLDSVYKAHHLVSVLSVFLVLLHPILLLVNNPNTLLLLNPLTAPWRAQAGIIGLAGLLIIAITSVLRQEIKLDYNIWHSIHLVLALVIVVFGLIHIFKVNYYSQAIAMRIAWLVEILIWVGLLVYMRIIKPLLIKQKPYSIKQVIQETDNAWTIVLKPEGHDGLNFNAAQVAWINIDSSPFTLHRNPFSISGSAEKKKQLQFTIKDLGDFTSTIGKLKGNEIVYVDGPYGNFSIDDEETKRGLVLLAGGIGIAPVLSILQTLADRKDKRPVHLFYANVDYKSIIGLDKLEELKNSLKLNITYVLEKPSKKIKAKEGFITRYILEKNLPVSMEDLHFFICGPLPMIEAMEKIMSGMNIKNRQITSERYEMA